MPADLKGGASFLRLRIGPNAASVAGPTGVTTAGEVEDHALVISATDFGDAPASYGTTVAGTGASHVLTGYNPAAGTAAPMLGTRVDDETDGAPSANADGDDAASTDDEDGVAFYTDVSVSGRLETVYVTSSAAGLPQRLDRLQPQRHLRHHRAAVRRPAGRRGRQQAHLHRALRRGRSCPGRATPASA